MDGNMNFLSHITKQGNIKSAFYDKFIYLECVVKLAA